MGLVQRVECVNVSLIPPLQYRFAIISSSSSIVLCVCVYVCFVSFPAVSKLVVWWSLVFVL